MLLTLTSYWLNGKTYSNIKIHFEKLSPTQQENLKIKYQFKYRCVKGCNNQNRTPNKLPSNIAESKDVPTCNNRSPSRESRLYSTLKSPSLHLGASGHYTFPSLPMSIPVLIRALFRDIPQNLKPDFLGIFAGDFGIWNTWFDNFIFNILFFCDISPERHLN